MYFGWSFTIVAKPLIPMYFKLCESERINRLMAVAAASSKSGFG